MARASVREAIQSLTSVLSSRGTPKVPSEVFRQAKFDNSSVIEEMWTVVCHLYELIQLSHGRGHSTNDFLFTSGNQDKLRRKWMKWQVKRFASGQGYARANRLLEEKESSRELLILFGWLLQNYRIVSRLLQMCLHEAVPTLPPPQCLSQLEPAIACLQQELDRIQQALCSNTIDKCLLQQLILLRGGMTAQCKQLNLAVNSYQKLVKQIHQYTHNPKTSGDSLTIHDVYLLRHPHLIAQQEKWLEKRIAMLGSFAEWEQLEDIFWKWMSSVLELADSEQELTTPTHTDRIKDLSSQVQDLINEADSLLNENSYHLSYLNDLVIRAKVRLLPHQEESVLKKVLRDIHEEGTAGACSMNKAKGSSHKLVWDGPFLRQIHVCPSSADECKALQERKESIKQLIVKQTRYYGELVPDSMAI